MIRINQIKISIYDIGTDREKEKELVKRAAASLLNCRLKDIRKFKLVRRSIDAREKSNILFVYTADVRLHDSVTGPSAATEADYVYKLKNKNIRQADGAPLILPTPVQAVKGAAAEMSAASTTGTEAIQTEAAAANKSDRPVVVGSGPCGLFAAYVLAECGLCPIVLERGEDVDARTIKTERFFESGKLDPDCNIQFGEGGAGAFSDGKLNTSIKDKGGYIEFVLKTFVKFGADPDILIDQKPHVGTDVLVDIVKNMRKHIIGLGGKYIFSARFDGFETEAEGACARRLTKIYYTNTRTGKREELNCSKLILATGHSARDTYKVLRDSGIELTAKPFAAGVRIQHPQVLIDAALYGEDNLKKKQEILGPAAYKLTHTAANGRNCYSFCMCPGGYVVNSSSEEGRLCINGMSYNDRGSGTANSAIIVNVTPEDYFTSEGSDDVLTGLEFQRRLEELAYRAADGVIPYETYKEFREGAEHPDGITSETGKTSGSADTGAPSPAGITEYRQRFLGYAAAADVRGILPKYMGDAIADSMPAFGRIIKGFDSDDAIIAGVEARTSSPVRIPRDEKRQCNVAGIYPAGEGAGYAGGITSAAADGIKTALSIAESAFA